MLELLRIQNYALIDELEIEFGPGLNAITGETGAGKSIIVGALNLVLGGRASSDALREGAKQAKIDAIFRIAKPSSRLCATLADQDIILENNELLLSRVVTAEGRSRAYVGGNLVPISVLAEVGDELVDIHGQHEHQSLLKIERQLNLLDAFANADTSPVADLVAQLRDIDKTIAELETDDRERARRVEFMRHEVGEIDTANPVVGEDDDLKARRNLIDNAERVFNLAATTRTTLYDDDEKPAIAQLDAALAAINELVAIDERFKPLSEQVLSARTTIDEVAAEIIKYTDALEFDPEELETINQRLALISDLKRKYGASIQGILDYRDRCRREIENHDFRDTKLAEARLEREKLLQAANKAAQTLSERRKNAASKIDKQITTALAQLGMKGGAFKTTIEPANLSSTGIDKVEFLLSANPGEKPKPLRTVASGGEISRIMLALKATFAGADRIPTLIFDEIDAGVGGRIARDVAAKLKQLSQSHQIVCITHIAQIAAAADHHYTVTKTSTKTRTATSVAPITGDPRIEEIARLLDGSAAQLSLDHAKSLLTLFGK